MAEALTYTLVARGVSEGKAEAAAGFLVAAEFAGRGYWCALDADYGYEREGRTACFGGAGQATWPDADRELAELSGLFPDALFVLDATGFEEEMSRRYFRGGRFYAVSPEIAYPEFDEGMLGCA